MKSRITILNYGIGNIHSVWHACKQFSEDVRVISNHAEYDQSTHIVLPGVGAFDVAISEIRNRKFDELIGQSVKNQLPILGICIGMHVLARIGLENGKNTGIGIFDAEVRHLSEQVGEGTCRIPHIGWAEIKQSEINIEANNSQQIAGYFYFAHSYGFMGLPTKNLVSEVVLGNLNLPAVVRAGNTLGVQFHPEKSGKNGLSLLKTFFESE